MNPSHQDQLQTVHQIVAENKNRSNSRNPAKIDRQPCIEVGNQNTVLPNQPPALVRTRSQKRANSIKRAKNIEENNPTLLNLKIAMSQELGMLLPTPVVSQISFAIDKTEQIQFKTLR